LSGDGIVGGLDGITIVIPTYNEKENISIIIPQICKVLGKKYRYEIFIVDDDSPDGTWKHAQSMASMYPVRVYRRIGKRGLASAIIEGIIRAKYKNVIVMDADLQHPPEALIRMISALKTRDLVIASRYMPGGGVKNWSKIRLLISRGAIFLAHLLLPKTRRISDPMSGFFGLKKDIIRNTRLNVLGYKILLEIIMKGKYKSIIEVPYVFGVRAYGESKLSTVTIMDYIRHLAILMIQTGSMKKIFSCIIALLIVLGFFVRYFR